MPALAKAIEQQKGNPADAARAIGTLVDSLLAGPHPTALLEKDSTHCGNSGKEGAQQNLPKCSYGSYSARVDLINSIWGLAQAMVARDPARASQVARAAMLLAAMNDNQSGWATLAQVAKDSQSCQEAAGPTGCASFAELLGVVQDRLQQEGVRGSGIQKALNEFDELSDLKISPMPLEKVNDALNHLDNAFRQGTPQDGARWWIISQVWSFLNIARFKQDTAAQMAIQGLLQAWGRDFHGPNIDRWISQALTLEAAVSSTPFVGHATMHPDGTITQDPRPKP